MPSHLGLIRNVNHQGNIIQSLFILKVVDSLRMCIKVKLDTQKNYQLSCYIRSPCSEKRSVL